LIRAAYLAAAEHEAPLAEELARAGVTIAAWHGRLALSPDPPIDAAWSLDTWLDPVEHPAPSVGQAAAALRAIQRNWSLTAAGHHRRAALIEARLPPVKARALSFPEPAPTSHLGAWTLLTPDTMLASPTKTSPFPNGTPRFEEDHIGPPSRAYLKLWEACTRLGAWPHPGNRCIDLGAAPGGWTWAIASLGATVLAIDKAPLDPAIAALPGVTTRQQSAFALPPEPCDWLFSDIIAYPERLLGLIEHWLPVAGRIVCTVKFQGAVDHATTDRLRAIPGSRLFHLAHNKNELTFAWQKQEARQALLF
jgi:23S rRNA (cytidine2498-2'-O)-methyltransferase